MHKIRAVRFADLSEEERTQLDAEVAEIAAEAEQNPQVGH